MLLVEELTRDVLCNELIEMNKSLDVGQVEHAKQHMKNMVDILMSPNDFMSIDVSPGQWTLKVVRKERT